VEVVEAFTIVLAVAITRSWRPALIGAFSALALLVVLVLVFGPLFALIPLELLQFVIGTLLILFGMRWLRKAILRASGYIALHDEDAAFAKETDALTKLAADKRADWLAGMAAFKAVLLEGVEVVFIVIAVGTAHHMTWIAGLGALAAAIAVLLVGAVVHKPLSTVPENTLKFAVGLMLTAFGIFWTGEGLGAAWPGADLSILGLLAVLLLFSLVAVQLMTRARSPKEAV
ncbi:MAG: TMEM165/GDT1 family protein, partial [Paracoccaceae bacterium]|nr:TMEM165/GDT1 family protein [Paracoccaceae bacterium]